MCHGFPLHCSDIIIPDAVADVAGPDLDTKPPGHVLPGGACDCHVHIFGAPGKVKLNPNRQYTPYKSTRKQLMAMHKTLGLERCVLVQPSTYGADNTFICGELEKIGSSARGVAVTDLSTSESEFERLHKAGYRGTRFNLAASGGTPLDQLSQIAARIKRFGWHLQFFLPAATIAEYSSALERLDVDLVFDHMGYPDPAQGVTQKGFTALLNLLETGKAWVKLAGAYRLDNGIEPWPDARPFAHALIQSAPDRCVWGSDWPHPYTQGPIPNDGPLLDCFGNWVDNDAGLIKKILVDNPAKLYGY
jgi:predicted TIM-barrel fold metal-dependent hydrolase